MKLFRGHHHEVRALTLIAQKNYVHQLQANKVKKIIVYGGAFSGKNLQVASELI